MPRPDVRKQMPPTDLSRDEFRSRFYERFADPAFEAVPAEIDKALEIAWDG